MAIDSLLAKLQVQLDTSDTSPQFRDVSPKAVPVLACTPDTSDTSQITNIQSKKSDDIEKEIKREQRRLKVLAILDDQPNTDRAVITDTESDRDSVIIVVAIRGRYTFDMLIPNAKYDGLALLSIIHGLKETDTQH